MATVDLAGSIRATIHGDVVGPGDSSHPAAALGIDPNSDKGPEMVAIAADAGDVAIAVRLAARAGRRIVLQSADGSPDQARDY